MRSLSSSSTDITLGPGDDEAPPTVGVVSRGRGSSGELQIESNAEDCVWSRYSENSKTSLTSFSNLFWRRGPKALQIDTCH